MKQARFYFKNLTIHCFFTKNTAVTAESEEPGTFSFLATDKSTDSLVQFTLQFNRPFENLDVRDGKKWTLYSQNVSCQEALKGKEDQIRTIHLLEQFGGQSYLFSTESQIYQSQNQQITTELVNTDESVLCQIELLRGSQNCFYFVEQEISSQAQRIVEFRSSNSKRKNVIFTNPGNSRRILALELDHDHEDLM